MEQKERTLEEKYAYAILALQAISTRNPYTENVDIENDYENYYDSKAFRECRQCAKTALKNLEEPEMLPGWNGGYKARQKRYEERRNKGKIQPSEESIYEAIMRIKNETIERMELTFKELFYPHIIIRHEVVGELIVSIEPFRGICYQDAYENSDLRTAYSFASDFLKQNIFTPQVLQRMNHTINLVHSNSPIDATKLTEINHNIQCMVDDEIHTYQNHSFRELWREAYDFYVMKMREEN